MKIWIKILIGAACGFAGGFASGFLFHKKLNDVQFEEISEEQMKEIEQKVSAAKEKAETKKEEKELPENLPEDPDKLKLALQGKKPFIEADAEQKQAYEKLWKATKEYSNEENANELPTQEDIPEEEFTQEEYLSQLEQEAEKEAADEYVEPPHVIGLADFYNDRPENDKITIHWYEPDNVWLDENEEIIPDIKSYIGMEVKSLFASNTPDDDPDVRFVRNDRYGSDYEIIRHHAGFRETVGGVE